MPRLGKNVPPSTGVSERTEQGDSFGSDLSPWRLLKVHPDYLLAPGASKPHEGERAQ